MNNTDQYPQWDEFNLPPENLLEMSLDVPNAISNEESILLRMEVKNVSGMDLSLGVLNNPYSDSNQNMGVFDFIITDNEGTLYWRNFYDKPLQDLPAIVTLNNDDALLLEFEWDRKDIFNKTIKTGWYQITGYYSIEVISDRSDGNKITENEAGFYTTQPQNLLIQ